MAVTANTIWEFQSGGDDTFGGGFDSTIANAGTDWSTATVAQATLTTLSVVGATTTDITVSATDYTVASTDVGNIFYLTGGSATAGFYQIITATTGAGQKWTMDRSVGTAGQTCPGKMGGCRKLLSSNSINSAMVAGNIAYVKSGSYSPGAIIIAGGSTTAPVKVIGYNSTRTDNPTGSNRPTLTMAGNNILNGASSWLRNFIITGTGTSVLSFNGNTDVLYDNLKVTSTNATSTSTAINIGQQGKLINSEVIAASCRGVSATNGSAYLYGCYIHGCTIGIRVTAANTVIAFNIFSGCSTSAIDITSSGVTTLQIISNTLFGAETPAGTGIDGSTSTAPAKCVFMNNIIYGFTTGVNWQASTNDNWWDYNDFFNNTTARTNVTAGANDIAVNPTFTSSAGGDFSVGTNLKSSGFPGAFQAGTSTGALDIGAVQRVEAASGGSFAFI